MALATRCPVCGARFRVASEQLRLRNGLVRCGACQHVFNAADRLDYVEAPSGRAPAALPAAAETGAGDADSGGTAWTDSSMAVTRSESPDAAPQAVTALAGNPDDLDGETSGKGVAVDPPAQNTSVAWNSPSPMPVHAAPEEASGDEAVHLSPIGDPNADAEREWVASAATETPAFLADPRPTRQWPWLVAVAVFLMPLLLFQALWLLHPALARAYPPLLDVLQSACRPLGCRPGLPMQPELLAVVGSDLQAIPGTAMLELDVVLRSRAEGSMALPWLELTLSDSQEKVVGRRVFSPQEYLPLMPPERKGLAALEGGADLPIRILFSAPAQASSGFIVYPFYP